MTLTRLKEKYEGKFLQRNADFIVRPWEPHDINIILITKIIQDFRSANYDTKIFFINEELKECVYSDSFAYIMKWVNKFDVIV